MLALGNQYRKTSEGRGGWGKIASPRRADMGRNNGKSRAERSPFPSSAPGAASRHGWARGRGIGASQPYQEAKYLGGQFYGVRDEELESDKEVATGGGINCFICWSV